MRIPIRSTVYSVLILSIALSLGFSGCSGKSHSTEPAIICGTSLIADIVQDISSLHAETYTLLPSSSCPSQFDMKAGDIHLLQEARSVLLHPWQLRLANITRIIDAAKLPDHKVRVFEAGGNWMIPSEQRAAVTEVLEVLLEIAPHEEGAMREKAAARQERIDTVEQAARQSLALEKTQGISVCCHEMQTSFLTWAGFTVAASFNRPEDYSVSDMESLLHKSRDAGVLLVVDNLQSGGLSAGQMLAKDLNAAYTVLTNFPGASSDTATWESAFQSNISLLTEALTSLESL
ncbi:MAG: zinc ABC transporter solute-binding protein [Candidatus Hydrogenedentes bacterium]|nr:zinc ABC transporter solute-binding protein [Candidatus Hydrogenedentota bacterium]